jgi:microcystin-dependent protein
MSKTLLPPSNELDTGDLETRLARLERAVQSDTGVWFVGDVKPTFAPVAGLTGEQEVQPNWLLLDGASVSTTKWPELFSAWGYQFGGSGANFTIPNGVGRFLAGRSSGGTLGTAGGTGGAETVTLTTTEMPSHAHQPVNPVTGFVHTTGGSSVFAFGANAALFTGLSNVGNTGFSGGGGAHNNIPPFLVVNGWLVYAGLKQA